MHQKLYFQNFTAKLIEELNIEEKLVFKEIHNLIEKQHKNLFNKIEPTFYKIKDF